MFLNLTELKILSHREMNHALCQLKSREKWPIPIETNKLLQRYFMNYSLKIAPREKRLNELSAKAWIWFTESWSITPNIKQNKSDLTAKPIHSLYYEINREQEANTIDVILTIKMWWSLGQLS